MRALVLTGPREAAVRTLPDPEPAPLEVVVDVTRVGICGTDAEFFTGEMEYLAQGHASYPLVLGHEWAGVVGEIGTGVPATWLGRRVTGDTMLGCGRCSACSGHRHHVCATRSEIGIRGSFPGALAERLRVPLGALLALPDTVSDTAGAMVEPGGNALRALDAADVRAGEEILVVGTGTIGLLVAQLARARGVGVHLMGLAGPALEFARGLDLGRVTTSYDTQDRRFDAVVDASNGADVPARALDLVQPGRRLVLIGLAGTPSLVDTRTLVLNDITAVGILGASAGLAGTIDAYATGAVDPAPLVAGTIGLHQAGAALGGWRPPGVTAAPKIHVDPRTAD